MPFFSSFFQCDSWKVKVHKQERKISDLEHQLDGQKVTIKILQAEKDHTLLLTQHAQEQRPATSYLSPRSAEVTQKPNYRISGIMKPRSTVSGQFPSVHETDFSIMLPVLTQAWVQRSIFSPWRRVIMLRPHLLLVRWSSPMTKLAIPDLQFLRAKRNCPGHSGFKNYVTGVTVERLVWGAT